MSVPVEQMNKPAGKPAVTDANPADPRVVPDAYRIVIFILICAGFLPLLSWHLYGLLERPHYQFAVLIPVAAWLLSVSDSESVASKGTWRNAWLVGGILFLGSAGLFLATWYWSPWLAAVSFLIIMPALIWLLRGMAGLHQWLRGWILCWMMIPLPFGMDQDLIVSLRSLTTRLTSNVLDQFQILHLQYGNVIEVPGKQLFIADACSGIHSLYVLMAAALFIGLWLRRSLPHILLMLLGAFFLVILENVSRLCLITAMLKYQIDLSVGVNHTILGAGLFVASLLILVSLDQMIAFFVSPDPKRTRESLLGKLFGPLPPRKPAIRELNWNTFNVFMGAAVLACGLGLVNVYQSRAEMPDFSTLSQEDIKLPEFGSEGLPKTILGFEQTDYQSVARVPGDPFGQASQQWTYSKEGLTVLLSIDYPYDGIHDLCVCYSQIGWSINNQEVLSPAQVQALVPGEKAPIAIGKLSRSLYGHGLLAFSLFDRQGHATAVIKELIQKTASANAMKRRLETDTLNGELLRQKVAPPYLQVQMLARGADPLNTEQEQDLLRFFIEIRKQLTAMSLENLQ